MNSVQSAVVQAILWEILHETDGFYSFGAGTFGATSLDVPTQSLLNSVNWSALPVTPITHHFDVLRSADNADRRQGEKAGTSADDGYSRRSASARSMRRSGTSHITATLTYSANEIQGLAVAARIASK